MRRLVALVALAGCGDNLLPTAPPTLSAGPVTIDTETLTLTFAGAPPLVQEDFLAIRTAEVVIANTFYDPRDIKAARFTPLRRSLGFEDGWLVLEGGTRIRLSDCPIANCAILDIDARDVENAVQVLLALPRPPLEPLYGTGDAPEHADLVGTVREMSLRIEPRSASKFNETHVPVPLVMWPRRGAGLFVADDRPGAFDLAKSYENLVTATFNLPERGPYRAYLFTAPTPLDLVRTYAALTSRPAVPPRWAFAPQHSAETAEAVTALRAQRIPGSAIWSDDDSLTAELTSQGYRAVFAAAPYVSPLSTLRREGVENGYLVTNGNGVPIDWPLEDGPAALIDFTRPGAIDWWRQRIDPLVTRGAGGFRLELGEDIVPEIGGQIVELLLADGDSSSHHNRYAQGYHDAYLGAFPANEGFVITRSGAWGEQASNTAIRPSDLDSNFGQHEVTSSGARTVGGLPSAISRGLSLSVSGYPFYGSDIGGARGTPTSATFVRWAQYAALGTIMHTAWDPTTFEPGTDVIYKRYADLHMLLNPLLWTLALQAGRDGTPVTVPAQFVFDCYLCDDAMFLLGDDILVAPVIQPDATTRNVVFPPGLWIDRETGIAYRGSSSLTAPTVTIQTPPAKLPMWYRAESLVPMFARHADTLLPATAPGVTSYADPAFGRELRLLYTTAHRPVDRPVALTTLHDGASAIARGTTATVTGGTQYTVFTLDIDTRGIPPQSPFDMPTAVSVDNADIVRVADSAALEACTAPGCWNLEDRHLQVRVFAATGQTRTIVVR